MGLTINNPVGGTILSTTTTKTTTSSITHVSLFHSNHNLQPLTSRKRSHIVAAKGKFTSRTSKFDSKNRRGASTTTTKDELKEDRIDQLKSKNYEDSFDKGDVGVIENAFVDDGFVVPELPGDKPDLWEGPQWDSLGFFVQYMWAFGVVFALVACGIAVATYNEGATDFRETPAYKESVQSQDLLEEPEASGSEIFESNPTEVAPALE